MMTQPRGGWQRRGSLEEGECIALQKGYRARSGAIERSEGNQRFRLSGEGTEVSGLRP